MIISIFCHAAQGAKASTATVNGMAALLPTKLILLKES
jgi:hypothetical protein